MLTKALKTRLQKFVDAVDNEDYVECWNEFASRMKQKEQVMAAQFHVGDEVTWNDKTGVVDKVNKNTIGVRENNNPRTKWNVSASLLKKAETLNAT